MSRVADDRCVSDFLEVFCVHDGDWKDCCRLRSLVMCPAQQNAAATSFSGGSCGTDKAACLKAKASVRKPAARIFFAAGGRKVCELSDHHLKSKHCE